MLLEVEGITKCFSGVQAPVLDQVSFALDEGERVGIIGRAAAVSRRLHASSRVLRRQMLAVLCSTARPCDSAVKSRRARLRA